MFNRDHLFTLTETFNIVYNTYIRLHLEYYAKDILILEKGQCRSTKLVIGIRFNECICGKINTTKTK